MTTNPSSPTADHLRTHDFDWYVAFQFATVDKRDACMAIFAYLAEIARVRSLVSDPMPGEIRLQWWRDTLHGTSHGAVEANPLAAALLRAVEGHSIPVAPLLAVLDARTFDLYDDAQPSVGDLEGYAGEVWSGPMSLAASTLSGKTPADFANVAGHGGVAFCIARILQDFPLWAGRGQCYLPADLMEQQGLERDALQAAEPTDELARTLKAVAKIGAGHLDNATRYAGEIPPDARPILLPLALARQTFARVEEWSDTPFKQPLQLPKWRRLWSLWRASKRMPVF